MAVRAAIRVLIAASIGAAVSAHGATFTVSNTGDSGTGSLREAVTKANDSDDDSDTIKFSVATITLITPLPEITNQTLILDGSAVSGLMIDGGGSTIEFLKNSTASDSLQFIDLSYMNGSITLASGTTLTLQGIGTINGDLDGENSTKLVKTGAGTTTTLLVNDEINLTGTSNNSTVQVEKGELAVNGKLFAATLQILPEGTFTLNGIGTVNAKTLESQGNTALNDTGIVNATNVTIKKGTFTVGSGAKVNATTVQSAGTSIVNGTLAATNKVIVDPNSTFTIGAGTGQVTAKAVESQGTFIVNGKLGDPDAATPTGPSVLIKSPSTFTVGAGGKAAATTVTVESQGALIVDGTLKATSNIEAQGPVTVNGTGSLSASTIEAQSTFTANGIISASSLTIGPSATLTGNGGMITAPVTIQGRLAPSGTTAGRLTINGDLSFASTSVLDVDLRKGADTEDRIVVQNNGVVRVVRVAPGAQIVFRANPSDYDAIGEIETVLTAPSMILDGPFVLATNYAFLDEELDPSDSTKVQIRVKRNALTYADPMFATTPNQLAVAQHLNDAKAVAKGDLAIALAAIDQSQADELTPLLDAIGGESLTAFATARQILGERTARALHRRTRDLSTGNGRAFYLSSTEEPDVAAGGDPAVERGRVRPSAWLDALGAFGELEGNTGEADVETQLYGATLGADAWIAERFVIGLAAGYARSDVDLDDRDADVFGDTAQGALYGGFVDPRGYLSAYGRYAYTFQDSSRQIESSALARHAHADWEAQDYGAGAEAGITLVSYRGFALQPIAGVDWLRLTEESYTEHGAGDLGLTVDPETLETTTARFGGRVFGRFEMAKAGTLVPELRAFYQHAYGDRERVLEARLSGAPGLSSIGVRGPKLPRDNLLLGVGWGVIVSEQLTVSFDYDAVLGSDRVEHQGNIAARVVF